MPKFRFLYFIAYLSILYISINVFFVAYVQPIGFDEAFNLQVAKSLSKNLIYQSTYYPRSIYYDKVTTNGLIQYLAAIDIKLLGDRLGLAVTMALISLFSLSVFLKYSWKIFIAVIILLFSYPLFSLLMTTFWGEMAALGFIMLGAYFNQKQIDSKKYLCFIKSDLFLSAVCYGLAISTKFISIVAVPFIIFGVFYSSNSFNKRMFFESVKNASKTYFLSLIVFITIFYFSVLHSQIFLLVLGQNIADFFVSSPGLLKFIRGHFREQRLVPGFSVDSASVNWLIPLVVASLLLLVTTSLGWVPLAVIVIFLMVKGTLHERRLFLFFVPVILVAFYHCLDKCGSFLKLEKKLTAFYKMIPSIVVLIIWSYALVVSLLNSSYYSSYNLVRTKFEHAKSLILSYKHNDNNFIIHGFSANVIKKVKEAKSPIIASGWWQFPELALLSGVSFYDRMDLSVQNELQGAHPLLLFDPTNPWPETSTRMCTSMIIELPKLVLCSYDMMLPLNHRWSVD